MEPGVDVPIPTLRFKPSREMMFEYAGEENANDCIVDGIVAVADDMKVKADGWLKLMKFEPRKIEPEPV